MTACTAICFDLFNTLVSVAEVPQSVGRLTADVLGIDQEVWNDACFGPAHEICKPTVHQDILQTLAHSIDPMIPQARIIEATRDRQARFDYALQHVSPKILDTLLALRRAGIRLALVSNASSGEVRAWPQSPLARLFELSLFSCECGYKKPESDIYRLALRGLGVGAEECLYVGDGGSLEFLGASRLGMRTLLTREFLKSSRYTRVMREQAEVIGREIESVRELLAITGK